MSPNSGMDKEPLLVVEHVSKTFGGVMALADVDLKVTQAR